MWIVLSQKFKNKLIWLWSNIPVLITYIKATLYTNHCHFLGLFDKQILWGKGNIAILHIIWCSLSFTHTTFFHAYLSSLALPEDLYAFSYNPKSSKEMRENGWKLPDLMSDFKCMELPNRYWTIADANRNYEVILSLLFFFRSM